MGIYVEIIENKPIDSNCYIIYSDQFNNCIVVDPGSEKCDDLLFVLEQKRIWVEYIILTHEHFDHVWGCNYLKNKFDCKILCSEICANNIAISKTNLSIFYDQKGFSIPHVDVLLETINWEFDWEGNQIYFFQTPGHSKGSICFSMKDKLFTGDTLIKGMKTVTKLIGGNKADLKATLHLIFSKYKRTTLIYPGHGDCFYLNDTCVLDFISN